MNTLADIRKHLIAPKGQHNKFGGYKYRSCEDILEALKPLLGEANLIISDEIVEVGGRIYVKATATLFDGDASWSSSGYAREAETRKGMDDSQITGSASSYARKYALNGLFCIDDTKDADHTNTHGKTEEKQEQAKKGGNRRKQAEIPPVEDSVAGCQNIRELTGLFQAISEEEQKQYKDLFSARKQELAA